LADVREQIGADWEGKRLESLVGEGLVHCEVLIDMERHCSSAVSKLVVVHKKTQGFSGKICVQRGTEEAFVVITQKEFDCT